MVWYGMAVKDFLKIQDCLPRGLKISGLDHYPPTTATCPISFTPPRFLVL